MPGCSAVKTTIEQPEDDIPTIEVEFDALSLSTVTAAATASYVSSSAVRCVAGVGGLGGSFTAPTNTALATGPTAFGICAAKLEIDHKLQTGGWCWRRAVAALAASPEYSWSGTAEFNLTTMQAAYIAGTCCPSSARDHDRGPSRVHPAAGRDPRHEADQGHARSSPARSSQPTSRPGSSTTAPTATSTWVYRTTDTAL